MCFVKKKKKGPTGSQVHKLALVQEDIHSISLRKLTFLLLILNWKCLPNNDTGNVCQIMTLWKTYKV